LFDPVVAWQMDFAPGPAMRKISGTGTNMRNDFRLLRGALCLLSFALPAFFAGAATISTYHGDTLRTGWNSKETTLNVANVGGGTFDLQAMTTLDSQVDAQPLVVEKQTIGSLGGHTVVYIVTGGDTLYAIDGVTGAVLLSRNFGTPVPQSALPGSCNNNGPTVGISSTPAIDTATGTMYLIADTFENGKAVFRVHAVSLATLKDTVTPVVVSASAKLADGTTYKFNANVSRQRAALLLVGGTLYAAFGSYCDQEANLSRGWMLGWNASDLTPLAAAQVQDSVSKRQSAFFLNSIWMSGYGPATAAAGGPIYVATGNSDDQSYGADDRDESVLSIAPDLSSTQGFFTDPKQPTLDSEDEDLGSGGAMLAPSQPGEDPDLLFAAGKGGTMYMLDRTSSDGLTLLDKYSIGGCWCGPSYFVGADGAGRVVTSGGSVLDVWRIKTSASAAPSLKRESQTAITSGQDPGFFTSVSTDGKKSGTAVIWAVARPEAVPGTMTLYAVDAATGKVIFAGAAGNWVSGNGNANIVPTVANGHVYVATYQELAIFGLGNPMQVAGDAAFAAKTRELTAQALPGLALNPDEHAVWGTIVDVTYDEMVLRNRAGHLVWVNLAAAREAGNMAAPVAGEAAVAIGRYGADGVLVASHVEHAKQQASLWPQDQ